MEFSDQSMQAYFHILVRHDLALQMNLFLELSIHNTCTSSTIMLIVKSFCVA